MSTLTGFLIVGVALVVALVGGCWQARRARSADVRRDQILRSSCQPPVPPALDNEQGINLADADECALIYSLPAYDRARERLKKRIASDAYYEATFRRIADDHELAPDLADFADRLLKEIRDDHTNTPEGDT